MAHGTLKTLYQRFMSVIPDLLPYRILHKHHNRYHLLMKKRCNCLLVVDTNWSNSGIIQLQIQQGSCIFWPLDLWLSEVSRSHPWPLIQGKDKTSMLNIGQAGLIQVLPVGFTSRVKTSLSRAGSSQCGISYENEIVWQSHLWHL